MGSVRRTDESMAGNKQHARILAGYPNCSRHCHVKVPRLLIGPQVWSRDETRQDKPSRIEGQSTVSHLIA
jgi:hypothetical protein